MEGMMGNFNKDKMTCSIETWNLSKSFTIIKTYRDLLLHPFRKKEIAALREVNISVKQGEFFALLGPNGAGKTTLIKILSTLILPSSGKAFVGGFDVATHDREVRRKIGYVVSDERSFYWRLTGRQNLTFFSALNNLPAGDAAERIKRLLQLVELERDADRVFKDYSTGMRQKLAIARGLLTDPDIIFMDEPTKALDPLIAHHIRGLVKERVMGERKRSVIYATHNLREAEELCDRMAIISNGAIRYTGTVDALKNEYRQGARYIVKVRHAGNGLLDKIKAIPSIKSLSLHTNGSSHDYIQFEMELETGNGNMSHIINELSKTGGKVASFYEKEPTLEEVFSRVVSREG
ncbi:MAG: ABC transporter ATP-binding protein [Candidatus Sulfobium sp.]